MHDECTKERVDGRNMAFIVMIGRYHKHLSRGSELRRTDTPCHVHCICIQSS